MTIRRICRFTEKPAFPPRLGYIEGTEVHPLLEAESLESINFKRTHKPLVLDQVRLLAPVTPSKIVCVGRNYRDHAAELGNPLPDEPLLFLKPPTSIIGTEDEIEIPGFSQRVEHEGELGVVIGRRARLLRADEDPHDYILGYTCANDVTARDLQRRDVQFTRAKSFDTFCPVGPYITTGLDASDLKIETYVEGLLRQSARTSDMVFSIPYLLHYISQIMTLEVGDLILTGTPAGVGPLIAGETVVVAIEALGTLRNSVRNAR